MPEGLHTTCRGAAPHLFAPQSVIARAHGDLFLKSLDHFASWTWRILRLLAQITPTRSPKGACIVGEVGALEFNSPAECFCGCVGNAHCSQNNEARSRRRSQERRSARPPRPPGCARLLSTQPSCGVSALALGSSPLVAVLDAACCMAINSSWTWRCPYEHSRCHLDVL